MSLQPTRRAAGRRALAALALLLALPLGAQTPFTAGGASASDIQPTVDAFRTALGALNANVAGSFGSGRREINWDGVPDNFAAPSNLPPDFFNVNSPRGVVFSTPGTGVQVSADASNPTATPVRFGNIDPSYTTTFQTFTPERLFTAVGSNIVDVNFFVPGSTTAAFTRGFGSVFSDVDLASTTLIQFFGAGNALIGSVYAPAGAFSFAGLLFSAPVVSRVRITSGNAALAAGATDQNGNLRDVVAMDDFIYGEPISATAVVPEPATMALVGSGLALLAVVVSADASPISRWRCSPRWPPPATRATASARRSPPSGTASRSRRRRATRRTRA